MTDLEIMITGLVIGALLGWCGKSARDANSDDRRYRRIIRKRVREAKRGRDRWSRRDLH